MLQKEGRKEWYFPFTKMHKSIFLLKRINAFVGVWQKETGRQKQTAILTHNFFSAVQWALPQPLKWRSPWLTEYLMRASAYVISQYMPFSINYVTASPYLHGSVLSREISDWRLDQGSIYSSLLTFQWSPYEHSKW